MTSEPIPAVLVVGVYLTDVPTNIVSLTDALRGARSVDVTVSYAALGHGDVIAELKDVTDAREWSPRPKFALINDLLSRHEVEKYDFVIVTDDDIEIADGWLDAFLGYQQACDFSLCQPARTPDSFIDHPFTQQMYGVDARRTSFVEIGPLFSVRKDAFGLLLPFDEVWPMGWGLDLTWPVLLGAQGLRMGIIDATPVTHSMREPQTQYSGDEARELMGSLLKENDALGRHDAQRVHETLVGTEWRPRQTADGPGPALSVVICTRNRHELLRHALGALLGQTLDQSKFEVIVIDDGSTDGTEGVVTPFEEWLPVRYAYQRAGGLASGRNHGLLLAGGDIILFLDDDDVADPHLLEEHLDAHSRFPDERVAILGQTVLPLSVERSFLMEHVVGSGGQVFSYTGIDPTLDHDYRHFWGGRTSAKRLYLVNNGIFDPQFDFGAEDIELGYRLRKWGLTVRYEPKAVSWMIRTLGLRELLVRSQKQGRSYAKVFEKHADADFLLDYGLAPGQRRPLSPSALVEEVIDHTDGLLGVVDTATAGGILVEESVREELGLLIDWLAEEYMTLGFLDAGR